jgi:hypothetical protein
MTDASAGTVEVRHLDGVAILTLTRPGADNRITRQMAESGAAALAAARNDRSTVGCVLTGDGDVFCTGGDYLSAGRDSAGRLEFGRAFNNLPQAMSRLGKPLLEHAVELAGSTRQANPDIIGIGRDQYYATRGATPRDAGEQARIALVAALRSLDESAGRS